MFLSAETTTLSTVATCSHVLTRYARGQRAARRLWDSVALGTSQALLGLANAYSHRKSQLAIEYAYRVRQRSPDTWVFWVHASNSARVEATFGDIAEKVGLSSQPGSTVDTCRLVHKWLCSEANGPWLMIVDNLDTDVLIEVQKEKEKVSLASLLPQTDHGSILITSRNADIARSLIGREKDIIAVGAMSNDEAVQLLENYLGDKSMDGAIRLVSTLDCIPLAIVQAAAYINRLGPRMSILKYLEELETTERQAQLLRKAATDLRRDEQASNSVLMTWQISFDHIRQKQPRAADLLSLMSFFNRQGIPEFMMRYYTDGDREGQDDSSSTRSEEGTDFEEDVAVLRAFSLVDTTKREDEFEMHGLVQLATRLWLRSTNTERKWCQAFIQAMSQEFPIGEYENWPKCQTLFSHALPLVEEQSLVDEKTEEWALLLNNVGWYASQRGLFAQAKRVVSKALEIRKEVLGGDAPGTLHSLGLLASILSDSGKYAEAESINRETLAARKKVLGKEHRGTLTAMNNLAFVLDRQAKYEEAESILRETLAAHKKVLGEGHPGTLVTMSNLGEVQRNRGKYEEAESIHRETLAARKKVLGEEHPDTLVTMNNLGVVLGTLGKYEEAESIYRQTLATNERVLGKEHPNTLAAMSSLGVMLHTRGKYKESELLHREAVALYDKVLGKDHPDTLTSVYSLAYHLQGQHRYDESNALYERACAGFSAALGNDHPTTRECRGNYSRMFELWDQDQDQDQHDLLSLPPLPHPTVTAEVQDRPRNDGPNVQTGKVSRGSRVLAKLSIRRSKGGG